MHGTWMACHKQRGRSCMACGWHGINGAGGRGVVGSPPGACMSYGTSFGPMCTVLRRPADAGQGAFPDNVYLHTEQRQWCMRLTRRLPHSRLRTLSADFLHHMHSLTTMHPLFTRIHHTFEWEIQQLPIDVLVAKHELRRHEVGQNIFNIRFLEGAFSDPGGRHIILLLYPAGAAWQCP